MIDSTVIVSSDEDSGSGMVSIGARRGGRRVVASKRFIIHWSIFFWP